MLKIYDHSRRCRRCDIKQFRQKDKLLEYNTAVRSIHEKHRNTASRVWSDVFDEAILLTNEQTILFLEFSELLKGIEGEEAEHILNVGSFHGSI